MPPYLDQSLAKLKQFEGCIPWMYRDTAGNVTVGVGLMLPNPAAACTLPFQIATRAANPDEIAAEFARVDALAMGKLPAFYKPIQPLELSQTAIDAKLLTVLTGFETILRTRLPGYDTLPTPAKLALLDMAYNLGPAGLLRGYPHLIQSVETRDWAQAATECARHGISPARNAWTAQQFLAAQLPQSPRAVASGS